MKAETILRNYQRHTSRWLQITDETPEQLFFKSINEGWTIAQVIDHICKTTELCIQNTGKCIKGKGELNKPGFGPAIFSMLGSFPPVRLIIKNPPESSGKIYYPVNLSKQEAKIALSNSLNKMEEILPEIIAADSKYRVRHWAGGWFNALQWYHSAEMHIKHHFRQLNRINRLNRKLADQP